MQHQAGSPPLSLVCIAAPDDSPSLAEWEMQLLPAQQAGWLSFWSERSLQAGDERKAQLTKHLDQANIIVLLLSAGFFASEECLTLMNHALHHMHDGTAKVIPLLVRPVLWRESPLGLLSCLPLNEIPVLSWERQDEGWHACALGLQRLLRLSSSRTQQTSTNKHDHSDRGRLLRWLSRDYQYDLDGSLQHLTWLELGLLEQPDAVRNATHLLARRPDHSEQALPVGTSILDAYDQAEEALLILGDPGAGKSTLLRDLALQLITRAQEDNTHPLPVILPLSSWAVSKPEFSDWMVEQLARIYDVPRRLGRSWVNQGQILPLLDGLDELEEAARPLCIAAINTYRRAHFTPLVVCGRSAEYQAASAHQRLVLQNAVVVQPLTHAQVEQVIQQGGAPLAALREAFRNNQELHDLATTPLMLSVLVLAYDGITVNDLPLPQEALEHRVWTDYVERMVREKGDERQSRGDIPSKRYSLEQTHSWLCWLAQQMRMHNQTLFYGELLLEDWIPTSQQRAVRWLVGLLPAIVLGAVSSLLLSLFMVFAIDLTGSYQRILMGGFLGWCLCANLRKNSESQRLWKRFILQFLRAGGIAAFVFVGVFVGLYADFLDWMQEGYMLGCLLISLWLLQVVFTHLASFSPLAQPVSRWGWLVSWLRTLSTRRALWAGVILGVGPGVSDVLISLSNLRNIQSFALSFYLSNIFSNGLIYGGTIYLVNRILEGQTGAIRLSERISWTWHSLLRARHLRISLLVAMTCLCFFLLSYGLGFGRSSGPGVGLQIGLGIGIGNGLSIGLGYWFLLGMYQGITQKHLEDKDHRRFNQGLRRSWRNSLLLSLLGAGIITATGILSNILSNVLGFGLSNALTSHRLGFGLQVGLSYGLSSARSNSWFFFFGGWFIIWAATGGLTILRHYTLRLLLAGSHTFPLHTRRFLDDASARVLLRRVGGGYGFVHRRLLDYFADTGSFSADASQTLLQIPSASQSTVASLPGTLTLEGLPDTSFSLPDGGIEL